MNAVKKVFKDTKICLASSEGLYLGEDFFFDAARCFQILVYPISCDNNFLNIKQIFEIYTDIKSINGNKATINIGHNTGYKKELLKNPNLSVMINNKYYKVLSINDDTTDIEIDSNVKKEDKVYITKDKDLYVNNVVKGTIFIGAELNIMIAKNAQINYIDNNNNIKGNWEVEDNEDIEKTENFRYKKKSNNIIETYVSEKRPITKDDEYVGYDANYKATKNDLLMVLPLGYWDNVLRADVLNGNYTFDCNGIQCFAAGNISMNQLTIKTDIKNKDKINIEDKVTLTLNKHN